MDAQRLESGFQMPGQRIHGFRPVEAPGFRPVACVYRCAVLHHHVAAEAVWGGVGQPDRHYFYTQLPVVARLGPESDAGRTGFERAHEAIHPARTFRSDKQNAVFFQVLKRLLERFVVVAFRTVGHVFAAFDGNTVQAAEQPIAQRVFEQPVIGQKKHFLPDMQGRIQHIHQGTGVVGDHDGRAVEPKVFAPQDQAAAEKDR